MSFVYTNAARAILAGEIDLASDDIRILLVMTNTTADTDRDVATIGAIGTLDEFDGSGYSRKTLASKTVAADNANDRGEFDAADISWNAVQAGTRDIAGIVVYRHVTDDSNSVPLAYIDADAAGLLPTFTPNGGDIIVTWNVEGILQAAS